MNVQLLTPAARGAYLDRIQGDIASAEHFVLVTAFATADGIALLEPAMRTCLYAGGQGTLVLALDRQHFNAADVFEKLSSLVKSFPDRLDVRVVREGAGLLHAKAVFAKLRDGTATLLVGSANLTERAFAENHELGLWVNLLGEPEVSRTFQRFVQNLGGTSHDAEALRQLARTLQETCAPSHTPAGARGTPAPPPPSVFTVDPPPPDVPIDTFVGDWLRAGSIVGRGRRGLDVLVIRTPGEQLEHLGLIDRKAKKKIAAATEKTVSAGYGVRLLPDEEDERLRRDARRTSSILSKLTLNLPCFGLWMPRAYWDCFQEAAAEVQRAGISTEAILTAAALRRSRELDGVGIKREVDAIVADLQRDGLVRPSREGELRAALVRHFSDQLAARTPELVARVVGFRTQRQALASDLDLRATARSFFADLVQSTFAATYRTGVWPGRFRSFVGRELARRIAQRCLAESEAPTASLALRLLDMTNLVGRCSRNGKTKEFAHDARSVSSAPRVLAHRSRLRLPARLIGSHIARWADDADHRGETSNGLCFCVLHDRAFEVGWFVLDDDFRVRLNRSKRGVARSEFAAAKLEPYEGVEIASGAHFPSVDALRAHRRRVAFDRD